MKNAPCIHSEVSCVWLQMRPPQTCPLIRHSLHSVTHLLWLHPRHDDAETEYVQTSHFVSVSWNVSPSWTGKLRKWWVSKVKQYLSDTHTKLWIVSSLAAWFCFRHISTIDLSLSVCHCFISAVLLKLPNKLQNVALSHCLCVLLMFLY